jgi:hypothetical protein
MKRWMPGAAAAAVAAVVVLLNLDAPLVEDGLFWWVPKALWVSEHGPSVVLDQLPSAARPEHALPPQWVGGLPDYGHPPGWYWYLGAVLWAWPGSTHVGVHVAALPLAIAFGWGSAALLQRAGGNLAAWGALALPLLPPVAAQLVRADTDLPLLAATPWALAFLLDRKDGPFALVAAAATLCKEPGILLAAPAVISCVVHRRWGWGWLAPPVALAAWAAVHWSATGWGLAGTERLPETAGQWLRDLGSVAWLVLGAQGRVLLWPVAIWGALKWAPRRKALWVLAAHVVVQIGFFGTLNYLGGLDRLDAHTHVRYLLPALIGAASVAVALAPPVAAVLAVCSAVFLFRAHPSGPEASLYGVDVARAVRKAEIPEGAWVGSYAWTQLTRPYAGVVAEPRDDLVLYGPDTDPAHVTGVVVQVCEGEPLGRLQELPMEVQETVRVRHAWVRVHRVTGPPVAPPPVAP